MQSIFTDKNNQPKHTDLETALGNTYMLWKELADYVSACYPEGIEEWSYTKHGWFCRIKDKKRAILYLLPRSKFFKTAFVFGQKATEQILNSDISELIRTELAAAHQYAEGRGIRIDIIDNTLINDIKKLIDIKLSAT